jgi:hypothetical protein
MTKMKKIVLAMSLVFGGTAVLMGQERQDTASTQYRTENPSEYPQQAGRERIQATELPDDVKKALEGEDYRGWLISGTFRSQAAEAPTGDPSQGQANAATPNEEVYIVELKNGAETKTVFFDGSGKILEGMEDQYNTVPSNQDDPLNSNNPLDQTTPDDRTLPADPSLPENPQQPGQPERPTTPQSTDEWQTRPAPGTPTTPQQPSAPDHSGPR